jgi:hypothetical protein
MRSVRKASGSKACNPMQLQECPVYQERARTSERFNRRLRAPNFCPATKVARKTGVQKPGLESLIFVSECKSQHPGSFYFAAIELTLSVHHKGLTGDYGCRVACYRPATWPFTMQHHHFLSLLAKTSHARVPG